MPDDGRDRRQEVWRQRRILISNIAIELRAVIDLLGDVEIAAGVDDRVEPALIRLNESESSDRDEKRDQRDARGPRTHSRIVSGSTPIFAHHARYAIGEISDGLISLRPPQNTFV